MKNTIKLLGIIALVTVIGFSMSSCFSLGGGGGGTGASIGGTTGTADWPADDVWAGYGLSGLRNPTGGKVNVSTVMGMFIVGFESERAAYDTIAAQIRGINGVTVVKEENSRREVGFGFTTSTGHGGSIMYNISDKTVGISITSR